MIKVSVTDRNGMHLAKRLLPANSIQEKINDVRNEFLTTYGSDAYVFVTKPK